MFVSVKKENESYTNKIIYEKYSDFVSDIKKVALEQFELDEAIDKIWMASSSLTNEESKVYYGQQQGGQDFFLIGEYVFIFDFTEDKITDDDIEWFINHINNK